MKYHLRRTLGAQIATNEELCTLLAEIEDCLNSSPLCALSDDPFNPTYMSPAHFIIGEPLTHLPAADLADVKYNIFHVAIVPTTGVLAVMFIRIHSGLATMSTLAEGIS